MDDLWRTSLQRTQERFRQAEAKGLQLKLCLIQSTQVADAGDVFIPALSQSESRPYEQAIPDESSWPRRCGFGIPEVVAHYSGASYEPQPQDGTLGFNRSHYYASDYSAFKQYESLASDAGRCLAGLPGEIKTVLWRDCPSQVRLPKEPFSLWTDAVVELGLQTFTGSPLIAVKRVWQGGASIALDQLALLRQLPARAVFPQLEQINDPPDRWFSMLDNMFIASDAAIDIILSLSSNGDCRKKKPRGRRKADHATVQSEAKLAADWEQARDSGVYKPDFARDNKLAVKDLQKLLNRVATRRGHSE